MGPCKNCENRHRACHDTCEEYKTWKENERNLKKKDTVVQSYVNFQIRRQRALKLLVDNQRRRNK